MTSTGMISKQQGCAHFQFTIRVKATISSKFGRDLNLRIRQTMSLRDNC